MRRLAGYFVLVTLLSSPVWADDQSDAQQVVSAQLDAFRRDDADVAYGLAAPNIRRLFPTRDIFMRMVEAGYGPVFRSSNATFGPFKAEGSGFRQDVLLSDSEGRSWIASYTLERQPDGSVRITGCELQRGNDVGA